MSDVPPRPQTLRLTPAAYRRACAALLEAVGSDRVHAETVTGNLERADRRGIASHGMNNLRVYLRAVTTGRIVPNADPIERHASGAILVLDGRRGFGQVAMESAVTRARAIAGHYGVAVVAVGNCGHVGHLGDWTWRLAVGGVAALALGNANALVAPYGGREPRLGTNPLSAAIPAADGDGMALDMATSTAAAGYVVHRLARGEPIPTGWAIDAEGEDTTDPTRLFRDLTPPLRWGENFVGALLPSAGHKGYGLALVADLLAGALAWGKCSDSMVDGENQILLLAIDPQAFPDPARFLNTTRGFLTMIRDTAPRPGVREVLVPGDPERRSEADADLHGIAVAAEVWDMHRTLGLGLGVDIGPGRDATL